MKTPENAKWIKAEKGEGLSIVYYDKEGNKMTRRKDPAKDSLKGSKAWRHNNPGNLSFGPHARLHGAIGRASYIHIDEKGQEKVYTFAIFPNREMGHTAMTALLKGERFSKLTLNELPRKYTGVEEGKPDTKEAIAYRDFLRKYTKLDMDITIQSLMADEFNTLIKKMENYEGWHSWEEGEEYDPIQKVVGVKVQGKRISNYLVLYNSEKRWISREEAINLAEKRLLRAVVVHRINHIYLRPYPHEVSFKELIC